MSEHDPTEPENELLDPASSDHHPGGPPPSGEASTAGTTVSATSDPDGRRHRGRDRSTRARHRAPRRPRRRQLLVAGLIAAVGLGGAGVAVAVGVDRPAEPVPVDADDAARAAAAERADRGARPAGTASATPTPPAATPSASPSRAASPSATSRRPSASRSSATARRATTTAAADWVHPMPGADVTSCYGQRWGTLHAGIDLAMPAGTPIRAAGAGTVVEAGWAYAGYGISVVIDHGNGYLTHYAHQSRTAVSVGQRVAAGTVIGYEGSTGDSTGPHLHFEVHNGLWNQLDPAPWMRARGVNLGC